MAPKRQLVFINGAMGAGKTAVTCELNRLLERSVMLDGDWCWQMSPFVVNEVTRRLVVENIASCLNRFIRCGQFDHVLLCWVMHRQEIIDDLLSRLCLDGWSVSVVTLTCSPDVLKKRLMRDVSEGRRQEDVIPRALGYLPLYRDISSIKLDTENLTQAQAAGAIASMLGCNASQA